MWLSFAIRRRGAYPTRRDNQVSGEQSTVAVSLNARGGSVFRRLGRRAGRDEA